VRLLEEDRSASRKHLGVIGNWRTLTPVASKTAFPIAATTAGKDFLPGTPPPHELIGPYKSQISGS
jgi:hypothetical protein